MFTKMNNRAIPSTRIALCVLILSLSLLITQSCYAKTTIFVGAHVIPIIGDEIPDGVVVVDNGKIAAVGSAREITLIDGATIIDASGKIIMPGLICTHSHIGGRGGGDQSGPMQPETRILDAIDVHSPGFKRALAGGLTTLNIMPGSGHLMSGQTIYVKLRKAALIEDMLMHNQNGGIAGGLKMANGTNSMRDAPFPGTRSKSVALVRQKFIDAQHYMQKIEATQGDDSKLPNRDLALELLVEVLQGQRVVHHHTHRHDDIVTVLRLQKEFGFELVLHHLSEGHLVTEEIAAANVPCSIIMIDSPGGKYEAVNLLFKTGADMEKAGINLAYHTDDGITDSRYFLRSPALGMRAGLSRAAALKSVTLAGAQMLDLDHRIGSLERGKDADLIILSGDPFSIKTHVLETWIEGKKVFDRSNPDDRLFAVGGYGAGDNIPPYMCCYEH